MQALTKRLSRLLPAATPLAQAVGIGWIEVTVKADANMDLTSRDVFSVGNFIGETGDGTSLCVNALDLGPVKRQLNTTAAITNTTDFNRDGRINALDLGIVKRSLNQTLPLFAAPVPLAPAGILAFSAPAADPAAPASRSFYTSLLSPGGSADDAATGVVGAAR